MRRTFFIKDERKERPTVGLVLGSGAARGWAHIGVIHELADMGIKPEIVVGASVGSIVAGAYAADHLDNFESWICSFGRMDIIRLLDASMTGGGFLQGRSLMAAISKHIGDPNIEDLKTPFACVATELGTGREVWLRSGSLLDACRASIALPGLFAPSRQVDGSLLVDGGLVNPVPISLARALGAEIVIAVNLNGDLVRQNFVNRTQEVHDAAVVEAVSDDSTIAKWAARMKTDVGVRLESYISSLRWKHNTDPGLFDVIVGSVDIMQDRITRSRMVGEPPDIHITPRLNHIGLMDFDRALECIAEGRESVRRQNLELELLAKTLNRLEVAAQSSSESATNR